MTFSMFNRLDERRGEPVLLVCSHPRAGEAWWTHIQGSFRDRAHRAAGSGRLSSLAWVTGI
jgi:hypothetical protein